MSQPQTPTAEITYSGQEGDLYRFVVTGSDDTQHVDYHGVQRTWSCTCGDDNPQGCIHAEMVMAWRRQRKTGDQAAAAAPTNGSPPPPKAHNGTGTPPPPKALPTHGEAPGPESPPPARAKRKAKGSGNGNGNGRGQAPSSVFPLPASGVSGWSQALAQALFAPFPADMVGWKAQATTKDGSKAMAVAYVDARAVADRLDETVGPENWCDAYQVIGEQSTTQGHEFVVECRLTVLGITKADVGCGEDFKAAYSLVSRSIRQLPLVGTMKIIQIKLTSRRISDEHRPTGTRDSTYQGSQQVFGIE